MVYQIVFQKEILKVSSWNIRMKLLNPAHVGGLNESQFMKAKTKENTTGIMVKMKKPMKLGAMNDHAVSRFFRFRWRGETLFGVFVYSMAGAGEPSSSFQVENGAQRSNGFFY
jgi:hypothetical protein